MQYPTWIRRPFSYDTTTADVNSPYTDDIIELQESEVEKRDFNTTNLQTFWCHQIEGYPLIAKVALEVFMPFVTTYLCEHAFSILVYVKAKKRNRLACENGDENCCFRDKASNFTISHRKTTIEVVLI